MGLFLARLLAIISQNLYELPWNLSFTFSKGWNAQLAKLATIPAIEHFQGARCF